MSDEKEINEKIEILGDLNKQLDDYDKFLDVMFANKNYDYNKLIDEIGPNDRCDLNWNLGFSTYTLYYSK